MVEHFAICSQSSEDVRLIKVLAALFIFFKLKQLTAYQLQCEDESIENVVTLSFNDYMYNNYHHRNYTKWKKINK